MTKGEVKTSPPVNIHKLHPKLRLLFIQSAGIIVYRGAGVCLENNKFYDNGEYSSDSPSEQPTGAILLEVCRIFTNKIKCQMYRECLKILSNRFFSLWVRSI